MNRAFIIMAGGTGGHVFPALAVARRLRERGHTVTWLGTRRGIEARVVPAAGIEIDYIDIQGLRGNGLTGWLALPVRLARAMFQTWRVFRRRRPAAALAMGGFVAGPGGLIAWLTRTPLVVHEQNAIAGLTNRWLARVATRVLGGFPVRVGGRLAADVGNPVRDEIAALTETRQGAADARWHLLIIGGSQGASALNRLVPAAVRALPAALRPDVWHQTGERQRAETEQRYGDATAKVTAFIDDMAGAYRWADLVVCRAGAMTIAELACAGKPSILVPFPYAVDDHQTTNARYLESRGAALLVAERELTEARLADLLNTLAVDTAQRERMRAAARAAARPQATDTVVRHCEEVAHA
jgi:UDP-N-acetylglucosamine--N-acetylmuramyl-(pentapeptide) pyrophosphoryl-undecaprenol N-acetylglucosamine transferase